MPPRHAPLILYIPGLLPKPPPELHLEAVRRCLLEGLRRADEGIAREIAASGSAIDIVSWTYDFYHEHRDIAWDESAIADAIATGAATPADRSEASSWQRRLTLWIYRLGNLLPFLIPHLATEQVEVHLRDLNRYVDNADGVAEHAREMLKLPLRAAAKLERPVLLLAHSMGSVIAYDTLWQLTHDGDSYPGLDTLLTMGSPLGQRYLRRRLLGGDRDGAARYPWTIRHWINLTAVGDMTAIDPTLADSFAPMLRYGLIDAIEDVSVFNRYRRDGVLDVHAEYGYLVNAVTGGIVADWWRRARP